MKLGAAAKKRLARAAQSGEARQAQREADAARQATLHPQALMSLGITCKGARNVKQLRPMDIEAARTKFLNECGVRVEDIGGIVIDEVSFIAAGVFLLCEYLRSPDLT